MKRREQLIAKMTPRKGQKSLSDSLVHIPYVAIYFALQKLIVNKLPKKLCVREARAAKRNEGVGGQDGE